MVISIGRWADLTAKSVCTAALFSVLTCGLIAGSSTMLAADDLPIDAVPLLRPAPLRAQPQLDDQPALEAPALRPSNAAQHEAEPASVDNPSPATIRAPEPSLASLTFDTDDASLSTTARATLQTFADGFKAHGGRVTLKAYAGAVGDTSSNARRLSLKRVLAVREFLTAQGIATERLEVRALGGVRDTGAPDRVDILNAGQ